jgi:guanine nucleotide-binding protein subunit alpha
MDGPYFDSFIKHLSRLCAQGYRPSNEDVIHARVRTTGIHRHVIQTSHNKYAVYDVGGERSERKKWIYGLEKRPEVTIFFAPISGYGQTLYEDQNGVCYHLFPTRSCRII